SPRSARLCRASRPRAGGLRRRHRDDHVRRPRRRPGEVGGGRRGARRPPGVGGHAVIRWVTETLRGRILMGLGILLSGLLVVSLVGVQALSVMRRTVSAELGNLRTSSEVGGGLVTAVFDEIRAA